MDSRLSTMAVSVLVIIFILLSVHSVSAGNKAIRKIPIACLPGHESFFAWYAADRDWDEEIGLDLDLVYFEDGFSLTRSIVKGETMFGAVDGISHLLAAPDADIFVFGMANDQSRLSAVLVPEGSRALETKGWNRSYPDIYGSPDDIRGKTFMVTRYSAAHFALWAYLRVFDLREDDVVIRHMDQVSIREAMRAGRGDFACLFAPYSFGDPVSRWIEVGNPAAAGAMVSADFIASREYGGRDPELVIKYLNLMMRGIHQLAAEGASDRNVKLLQRMYKEMAGLAYSDDRAGREIRMYPVRTLKEQVELFGNTGEDGPMRGWSRLIAEFLSAHGRLAGADPGRVGSGQWIDGSYLRALYTQTAGPPW